MSQLSKAQLATENSTSFPNNTTGYITPALLRDFNTDMIDSNVNQTVYTTDSASFDSRIDSLESFSSSIAIDYINQTELNAATASLSASLTTTINTKVSNTTFNSFSASVTQSIIDLQNGKANLNGNNSYTGSQAIDGNITASGDIFAQSDITASGNIKSAGISGSGLSIVGNTILGGNAFDSSSLNGFVFVNNINKLYFGAETWQSISASFNTRIENSYNSASFVAFTASYFADSASVDSRLDNLEDWSSSLDLTYATDAQLNASSSTLQSNINASASILQSNIDTKLNTSSFNSYTQSTSASIADLVFKDTTFITTGSTTETQYISGALVFTGSARISVSTASFFNDDTTGNDFLNLQYQPSGSAFSYLEAQTNLPQYLNQAIKVGTYTTGSTVGGMVKVVGNTSMIATGTSDEINPFGVLQVSQSVSSTNIKEWFAYNGNPQSDGEKTFLVQRGLHKVAGNGLSFSLAQAASYYVGAPIYWNGSSEGSMTITRPTDGRVLRLGYIASIQDDAANPYVRQIWFDPIWEEGETIYSPVFSGSVVLSNQANQFLAHITASSDSVGNIIFKTNSNTATTLLSGSGNLFVNPAAPTSGFVRLIGSGSGNIILNPSNVPQISSSMAFPINMRNNYFGGNGTTFSSRGPISSSAWTINGNSILGTVAVGQTANLNAEKIVNGLTITNNQIAGTVSLIATQAALSGTLPVLLNNNNVNGAATLNLSSSTVLLNNNSINDNNFTLTNRFYSSSIGLGRVAIVTNTIGGSSNQFIVSGSQLAGSQNFGAAFSQNIVLGSSNTIFINASESRTSGTNVYHNAIATGLIGYGLVVTGSSNGNDAASFGSLFAGRHNAVDGIRDKTSDIVFAVGTGTSTTNKKTGFLIDSGSNTRIEGTLNISGSVTANVIESGITSLTASLDFSKANFFTLTLAETSSTHILPVSWSAGQTANVVITAGVSSSVTFPSSVKQPQYYAYTSSLSGQTDVLTFLSVNTSSILLASTQTFI